MSALTPAIEPISRRGTAILWRQVLGVAVLQAAITFGYTAYGVCQPRILEASGFLALAAGLAVAQGLLGAIVEPLSGLLSDRVRRDTRGRFLVITVGVTAAGLVFVSVAIALKLELSGAARWALPSLMILWLAAMGLIRSPTSAILRGAAPVDELPRAAAVLGLCSGLVSATGPLVTLAVKGLGGSVTFLLGGAVLVGGYLVLRAEAPDSELSVDDPARAVKTSAATSTGSESPAHSDGESLAARLTDLALLFVLGLCVALALTAASRRTLHDLRAAIDLDPTLVQSILIVGCSLFALPAGRLAIRIGARRAFLSSLLCLSIAAALGAAAALAGAGVARAGLGAVVLPSTLLLAAGTALAACSGVPIALAAFSEDRAGLAGGVFFGGAGAASVLSYFLAGASAPVAVWLDPSVAVLACTVAALSLPRLRDAG